jgi:hypothetical protein
LSGKYLKKRYLLPLKDLTHTHIHGLSEKLAHAPRVSLLTKIASSRGETVALARRACSAHPGCTRNA